MRTPSHPHSHGAAQWRWGRHSAWESPDAQRAVGSCASGGEGVSRAHSLPGNGRATVTGETQGREGHRQQTDPGRDGSCKGRAVEAGSSAARAGPQVGGGTASGEHEGRQVGALAHRCPPLVARARAGAEGRVGDKEGGLVPERPAERARYARLESSQRHADTGGLCLTARAHGQPAETAPARPRPSPSSPRHSQPQPPPPQPAPAPAPAPASHSLNISQPQPAPGSPDHIVLPA
jgi:hypothetical protein